MAWLSKLNWAGGVTLAVVLSAWAASTARRADWMSRLACTVRSSTAAKVQPWVGSVVSARAMLDARAQTRAVIDKLSADFISFFFGGTLSRRASVQPCPFTNLSARCLTDMRLLLVEDDVPLAEGLAASLRLGGYGVDWFKIGSHASAALAVETYDAVVLDLNLPDADGLTLLKQWRQQGVRTPVLILSARDEIDDRVRGLDLGADDYLVKPFDVNELEARLRVLIRRMQGGRVNNVLEVGPLRLHIDARRAELGADELALTTKEFALMQMLAIKAGQVQPKDQLISRLSDFEQDMSANALDILIHRLRKKLEGSTLVIRTLRGFGYLLEHKP